MDGTNNTKNSTTNKYSFIQQKILSQFDGTLEDWSIDINSNSTNGNKDKIFKPVSLILSIDDNVMLDEDNNYVIKFTTGMLNGEGIVIDENGDKIKFEDGGTFVFQMCGNALAFSNVEPKLVYESNNFDDNIKLFTELSVPYQDNNITLQSISTMLYIEPNQYIIVKLIPSPNENILLLKGSRLIIYRVA